MSSWVQDVQYIIMPANHPVAGYEKEYYAAYKCWRDAWEKFRLEIGVKEPLYADGFVGADEIGAIFYQGNCVALSCFTYGSFEAGCPMNHLSWYRGWTEIALQKLKDISSNAVISSQFSVGPQFTGKNQVVRWKDILFLFLFMRFEHSIADVMAGHLNLTRKVDDACGADSGATVLNPNHPFNYFGVELAAQLVAYEKENVAKMKEKKEIISLCDDLWSKTKCISPYPIINIPLPLKKAA